MMPRRKNLASVVWAARNRRRCPYLMVHWGKQCPNLVVQYDAKHEQLGLGTDSRVMVIRPCDIRRLMLLMQRALDYRYGKRADAPGRAAGGVE